MIEIVIIVLLMSFIWLIDLGRGVVKGRFAPFFYPNARVGEWFHTKTEQNRRKNGQK